MFNNKQGTKTFFQYLGADSAVELLSKPSDVLKDYTTLGGNDDATNTNYLNYVFDYIDECNKIRKDLGLNELKVSAYLMADAELNANYASKIHGHSGANVSSGEIMRLVMALLMEKTVHLEVGMIKKRKSMMVWMKNIKN